MKHKTAQITANDGDNQVKITAHFTLRDDFVLDEMYAIQRDLMRAIARELEKLPYTDFGPENTQVTLLRRP